MPDIDLPPSQEMLSPREKREQRLQRLREKLDATFPGEQFETLRNEIEASFSVPQVGDYHNEGAFMDSHLTLIFETIDAIRNNQFPEALQGDSQEAVRDLLKTALTNHESSIEQYVFLHDISKKDRLVLKYTDGRPDEEISWDTWQASLQETNAGLRALNGDEKALQAFCEERGIESIGYFHQSEGEQGKHGLAGSERLETLGFDDEELKTAIELHEIAFVFNTPRADVYREHFGTLSPSAQDFALLATYIDTAASIRKDGKPDFSQFIALMESRKKSELLQLAESKFDASKYEKNPSIKLWTSLMKGDEIFTSAEEILNRFEAVRIRVYEESQVRTAIENYRATHPDALSEADVEAVVTGATTNPTTIGRSLGAKMVHWKAIEASLRK